MHITPGNYTLQMARGERLFLSSIAETRNGNLQAQFFCTNRKNAVTMTYDQAFELEKRLQKMGIDVFWVLAFNKNKDVNA